MTDIVDGLRNPLFPCMLEGDLLDKVNKQRADGADEIERLREALREIMVLSDKRSPHPMSQEADYFRIARSALEEKE